MKNSKMWLFQSQNSFAVVRPNLGRQILVTGMTLVLLGFVLLLHACEPAGGTKERESMSVIKNDNTASMANKTIDASLPANIKTATFALG
jgi:hypothetical protein